MQMGAARVRAINLPSSRQHDLDPDLSSFEEKRLSPFLDWVSLV